MIMVPNHGVLFPFFVKISNMMKVRAILIQIKFKLKQGKTMIKDSS